jgi:hypothetical protein
MVISHSATRGFEEASNLRAVSAGLGARYVVEGNVRQAGTLIRVTIRLVETETAAQLWSETYARNLAAVDIFTTEDELTERIVATIADALPHWRRPATSVRTSAAFVPQRSVPSRLILPTAASSACSACGWDMPATGRGRAS